MPATTTKIGIINRALQLLGSQAISSINENSRGAKSMLRAYDQVLLSELSAHIWNFSIMRASLVASAFPPIFGKPRAFPLPGDFLYLAPEETTFYNPERHDYQIEGSSILSSENSPLPIRYVSSNITESSFSATFTEAFSFALAKACCEELTNSNTKLAGLSQGYDDAIKIARRRNDMQNAPVKSPTCSFITVRQ